MRRLILLICCILLVVPLGTQAQQQLPAVTPSTVTGDIAIAGSPILESVTTAIATRFSLEGYSGGIGITANDTQTAFQQLCNGDIDIVMADRAILPQEVDACTALGRPPAGFRVSTSAVVVTVGNGNTFAPQLTSQQLQAVFSTALSWSEIDPTWPEEPINRFGPAENTAPFNLFVAAVFGGDSRPMVTAFNARYGGDQGSRLQAIAASSTAIGFFDANYALANTNVLRGMTLDGVAPTVTTIADNSYPLSRPLLLYTTTQDFTTQPQVASFLNYYLTNIASESASAGLAPAPASAIETARNRWLALGGSVITGQPDQPVPDPQATEQVIAPLEPTQTDNISATATALADSDGIETVPIVTPEPAPSLFDLETQELLTQARLDVELTAEEVYGGQRPEGWSGSLDIENRQLPLLIRLDLEVLAAQVYGIENRPDGWFGAVSSTQEAVSRDIRHDLELLADDVFDTRPLQWAGSDPIYRCDRSTQALVDLLTENGIYTLTALPDTPSYCQQVATEISRFVEVNLLGSNIAVDSQGIVIPPDVEIATTIAVGFYNTSATRRAGLIPIGTGVVPIARSYQGFSNMTLVEGDGFLLFVEWQNTSLSQAEWRTLPDESELDYTTTCGTQWC